VVYQHVQDMPVPPSEVSGGAVPPELDGLVMRSLAKDPDDRFQSAEEMRGLVQYALQMLHEAGGHTGMWNTGPVTQHMGGSTPAMGMPGTAALGHPGHGDTSQQPIITGRRGDDGGYDGGSGGHRGGGGGRGRVWLIAALAVIAVVAGVAFALHMGGSDHDKKPSKPQTSTSQEHTSEPSDEPSDEPTDSTPSDDSTGGTGDYTPTTEPSPTVSDTPTGEPTGEPTDDPTGEPTGQQTTPGDEDTTPPDTGGATTPPDTGVPTDPFSTTGD
jgi:eukaryotic-like serine/threonine-protein kinase